MHLLNVSQRTVLTVCVICEFLWALCDMWVPCELWVMIRYVSFDHAMTSCDVFQNGWIEERREILANLSRKASDRFGVGVSEAVRSDLEFEPRIRMIRSVLHKLGLQNRVFDVFIQAFWLFSMLGYVGHAETSRQTWWPENSTACLACSHCLWREPCMPSPRSLRRKWKLIRANQSFRFLFPPKWQKVEFCSWCTVSLSSSYL